MEKYILCIVMLAAVGAHRPHHPKFPSKSEEHGIPLSRIKVACSGESSREREKIIEQSRCGEPKEVFVHLDPKLAHEEVSPGAVWVKRCVGLCEYDAPGKCVPTETRVRHIPIRIFNAKTNKEMCATYPVEEHVRCGCCALGAGGCSAPHVYNPRKCSCQCPNLEERRRCIRKRNQNLRWNRSKCSCEERRRKNA